MLGILLATLAQLTGALGKILMKKAHTLSGWQARACNLAAFVSIIILNPVCGLAAYAYAAQSLLAPLSVLNLVWNAVLAWVLLGEVLRTRGILAYCLICIGTLEAALLSTVPRIQSCGCILTEGGLAQTRARSGIV